jgi:hypothetical protein
MTPPIDGSLTSALNGRMPTSMLAQIDSLDRFVWTPLAPQIEALRSAFEAHFGKPLVITESYRDIATQRQYRANYLAGRGAYAVPPGTSNHGWGTALDLGSGVADRGSAEHAWMVANGPRFGAHWLTSAGNGSIEPWHFDLVYVPASQYAPAPAPAPAPTPKPVPTPTPPPPLEDDMRLVRDHATGSIQLWHPNGLIELNGEEWVIVKTVLAGGPEYVDLGPHQWDVFRNVVNRVIENSSQNLKGQGL